MSAIRSASIALCVLCAAAGYTQTPNVWQGVTRVVLADFESTEAWRAYERRDGMTADSGLEVAVSLRAGAPADIVATESTRDLMKPVAAQLQVLGIRLRFPGLTDSAVVVEPEQPVPITGGTPWVLNAWVASENLNHDLYAVFLDSEGRPFAEVRLGYLNYLGWKRMSVAFQLVQPPGGLLWNGFVLRIDPGSIGPEAQYLYFDFVSASVIPRASGAGE